MGDMAHAGNIDAMRLRVHEYRGVMTTWDDDLGRIAVPPAAQPIIDKIGELNAAEIADLDALAGVDDKDKEQINRLLGRVYYDDALVAVQADHLSAALGHPESQGQIAADQLELANQTLYYTEQAPSRRCSKWHCRAMTLTGRRPPTPSRRCCSALYRPARRHRLARRLRRPGGRPARWSPQGDRVRPSSGRFGHHCANRSRLRDAPASQAAEDARSSLQNGLLKLASESVPPLQC